MEVFKRKNLRFILRFFLFQYNFFSSYTFYLIKTLICSLEYLLSIDPEFCIGDRFCCGNYNGFIGEFHALDVFWEISSIHIKKCLLDSIPSKSGLDITSLVVIVRIFFARREIEESEGRHIIILFRIHFFVFFVIS